MDVGSETYPGASSKKEMTFRDRESHRDREQSDVKNPVVRSPVSIFSIVRWRTGCWREALGTPCGALLCTDLLWDSVILTRLKPRFPYLCAFFKAPFTSRHHHLQFLD